MVQRYVFDELETQDLHAFVVWGPMLGEEERADAEEATRFLDDARSSHFWTPIHDLAAALAPVTGIEEEGELAWDTFLLYAPGQTWGETPPEPRMVQHIGKPLPDDQRLHGPSLRLEIEALLNGNAGDSEEAEEKDPQDEAAENRAQHGGTPLRNSAPARNTESADLRAPPDRPYR